MSNMDATVNGEARSEEEAPAERGASVATETRTAEPGATAAERLGGPSSASQPRRRLTPPNATFAMGTLPIGPTPRLTSARG